MIAALFACHRNANGDIQRIAILPFANLTGDSSLDWISEAGPAILADELAGNSRSIAITAPAISDAYAAKATRFLHATYAVRGSGLHFEFAIEDASSHRMIQTSSSNGGVLFAASDLARQIDPAARPFSTSNPDAIAAWGGGDFEQATKIDADFGAAWKSWVKKLAANADRASAKIVAARALGRASLRSESDRADIEIALAQIDTLERCFDEAAALYEKVLAGQPGNAALMNTLGYVYAFAGDVQKARQILDNYSRQPGQSTNALDSLGEAHFMNGRFAEAEKYFEQSYSRDPAFLQGETLLKAAYARWLSGDLPGADEIVARYLRDAHPQDAAAREAGWLYTTGRRDQAIAKIGADPRSGRAAALWSNPNPAPSDLKALQRLYENTAPEADGIPRVLYAAALVESGKTDQARRLILRWPLPEPQGDAIAQSIVFPRYLELRRQLR